MARVAGLENVTQVSPGSTSPDLSDKYQFPFFSRTNSGREAEAIVSFFRHMNWDRVTVIHTDTPYGIDTSAAFQSFWTRVNQDASGVWQGKIPNTLSVNILPDNTVDESSILQALAGVPIDEPRINSRVILLIGHTEHAYPILKLAHETNFQTDTIWVGTESWSDRFPTSFDTSWIQGNPGYIGVTPFRNRNEDYQDFLRRFQAWQISQGRDPWPDLRDYAAEYMVDSILAAVMALDKLDPQDRSNGNLVTATLRSLQFDGISGKNVSFTPEGDRYDPKFSIVNMQPGVDGPEWKIVGSAATDVGSTVITSDLLCFAEVGCRDSTLIPSDAYPVPEASEPKGAIIGIPIVAFFLLLTSCLYYRTRRKKDMYKQDREEMNRRIETLRRIDADLVHVDRQVEAARRRQAALIEERAKNQEVPKTWSNDLHTLVEVQPEDDQYWDVLDRMRETMPDVHISHLWRIQNTSLWTYYSFHKERLEAHEIAPNEVSVWHGTSGLDPSVIYGDRQDGFMMQHAARGYWGRAIYFAQNAEYSDRFAFKPSSGVAWSLDGARTKGVEGERELFLTKLLAGKSVFLDRKGREEFCQNLTVPPKDPDTDLKYNTVTGETAGSKVYMVYENGRAYPDYLVRYYTGPRDPNRTKYEDRGELHGDSPEQAPRILWEFEDNDGWKPYAFVTQSQLEKAHQMGTKTIRFSTHNWNYEVDLERLVQKNIDHAKHRERPVRRRECSSNA